MSEAKPEVKVCTTQVLRTTKQASMTHAQLVELISAHLDIKIDGRVSVSSFNYGTYERADYVTLNEVADAGIVIERTITETTTT